MTPAIALLAFRILAVVALYGFLVAVVIAQWKEMRHTAREAETLPAARLVVVDGPTPGQAFFLGEANVLGRAAENTVRVVDDTVSAYHARVWYQSGRWWLEDLGSRNGTRVNDVAVEQPIVLTYGDRVVLGRVCLELGRAGEDGPASPSGPSAAT
jgi:hypothetical protein